MIRKLLLILLAIVIIFIGYKGLKKVNLNVNYTVGQPVDSLNNVIVFYNGGVDHVLQRNTKDGYNLGLQYQCVEFVKRYYYQYYNHKMPDSYGHAISFFDQSVPDGGINKQRGLYQFKNPGTSRPKTGDLIVMGATLFNRYGHVAIISDVSTDQIEIIQQNPGPFSDSRETFKLTKTAQGKWKIENDRILGWLRK